jgi:hypothetical protein
MKAQLAGGSEIELIQVVEIDETGGIAAQVGLDPEDLDAARAELDTRHRAASSS